MDSYFSASLLSCSNRTFMELKFDTSDKSDSELIVLIVPLWN